MIKYSSSIVRLSDTVSELFDKLSEAKKIVLDDVLHEAIEEKNIELLKALADVHAEAEKVNDSLRALNSKINKSFELSAKIVPNDK